MCLLRHERAVEESCGFFCWQRFDPAHTERGELSRSRNEAAREKGHAMAQYLISFPSDAMDQIPEDEMPDVIVHLPHVTAAQPESVSRSSSVCPSLDRALG